LRPSAKTDGCGRGLEEIARSDPAIEFRFTLVRPLVAQALRRPLPLWRRPYRSWLGDDEGNLMDEEEIQLARLGGEEESVT
jgi:hypothetical protein